MTILYKIDNHLYVNLTNKCSCACTFCIRQEGDGVHGSDSLWLGHDISLEEALSAFQEHDLDSYDSVVFCGYGEPLLMLDEVIALCHYIRTKSKVKIRVNTNGLASLTHHKDVPALLAGYVDAISISLNAPDKETYVAIARPQYGEAAYEALLEFAKGCTKYIEEVTFSVVDETITTEQVEACRKIADQMHIHFRVRGKI